MSFIVKCWLLVVLAVSSTSAFSTVSVTEAPAADHRLANSTNEFCGSVSEVYFSLAKGQVLSDLIVLVNPFDYLERLHLTYAPLAIKVLSAVMTKMNRDPDVLFSGSEEIEVKAPWFEKDASVSFCISDYVVESRVTPRGTPFNVAVFNEGEACIEDEQESCIKNFSVSLTQRLLHR